MDTDYESYELTKTEWQRFCVIAYVTVVLLCLLFYHSILFAAVCGAVVLLFRKRYSLYMAKKRKELLIVQFKDMLISVSASVAAGRHMREAMAEALDHLKDIYDDDSPLVEELDVMVRSIRENRDREEELLRSFASRSHVEDIKNFVDVYLICRTTGGDMQQVVNRAAEIICEKMDIERDVKMQTAQRQYEGAVITAIPIVLLFMLNLTSPDYIAPLYDTFQGRIIMTVSLAGMYLAWDMTMKLMDIEV